MAAATSADDVLGRRILDGGGLGGGEGEARVRHVGAALPCTGQRCPDGARSPGPEHRGPELFVVQAGWRDQVRQLHGAAVTRGTKKAALQGAVVSLLGHMSGCERVEQADFAGKGRLPAARYSAGSAAAAADPTFASRLLHMPRPAADSQVLALTLQ
jgi:hypothetical protein